MKKEGLIEIGEKFVKFYDRHNPTPFSGAVFSSPPRRFGFEVLNETEEQERFISFPVESLKECREILNSLSGDEGDILTKDILNQLDRVKPDLNKQLFLILEV